jgi:hypothetical protein
MCICTLAARRTVADQASDLGLGTTSGQLAAQAARAHHRDPPPRVALSRRAQARPQGGGDPRSTWAPRISRWSAAAKAAQRRAGPPVTQREPDHRHTSPYRARAPTPIQDSPHRRTGVQSGTSPTQERAPSTTAPTSRKRLENTPSVLRFSQIRPARRHLVHILPSTSDPRCLLQSDTGPHLTPEMPGYATRAADRNDDTHRSNSTRIRPRGFV